MEGTEFSPVSRPVARLVTRVADIIKFENLNILTRFDQVVIIQFSLTSFLSIVVMDLIFFPALNKK